MNVSCHMFIRKTVVEKRGEKMDKSKIYHFTGIKGSGMSALALVLHGEGYKVQGSDLEQYFFTQKGLEEAGITLLPLALTILKKAKLSLLGMHSQIAMKN